MHAHDADEVAVRAAQDVRRLLNRDGLNRLTELAGAQSDHPEDQLPRRGPRESSLDITGALRETPHPRSAEHDALDFAGDQHRRTA